MTKKLLLGVTQPPLLPSKEIVTQKSTPPPAPIIAYNHYYLLQIPIQNEESSLRILQNLDFMFFKIDQAVASNLLPKTF